MIDLNEMMTEFSVRVRVANVQWRGRRQFYWRMRIALFLWRLAARIAGFGFEEEGVDPDEL